MKAPGNGRLVSAPDRGNVRGDDRLSGSIEDRAIEFVDGNVVQHRQVLHELAQANAAGMWEHAHAELTMHVAEKPGAVSVDPFHLMIDRMRDYNQLRLPPKSP